MREDEETIMAMKRFAESRRTSGKIPASVRVQDDGVMRLNHQAIVAVGGKTCCPCDLFFDEVTEMVGVAIAENGAHWIQKNGAISCARFLIVHRVKEGYYLARPNTEICGI